MYYSEGKLAVTTAIIDVSVDLSEYNEEVSSTKFYMVSNSSVVKTNGLLTEHGANHGGLCLGYFYTGAKRPSDFFILLTPDESGKCSVDELVTALSWCGENGIQLISMSLGTRQHNDACKLFSVIESLSQKGVIILASASNDRKLTYPACFKNTIGICVDNTGNLPQATFSYQENIFDGIELIVSRHTAMGAFIGSNSVATAYFAGTLTHILQKKVNVGEWLRRHSAHFPLGNTFSYCNDNIQYRYEDNDSVI